MSCDWPIDRTCLAPLPDEASDEYAAALAKRSRNEDTAVLILYSLTARRFGLCPYRVRPCRERAMVEWMDVRGSRLLWWDGSSWATTGCGCTGRCIANGPGMVHLPGPVAEVSVVTLGDTVLDESAYSLEGNVLYRTSGHPWPAQNLSHPLGAFDTWSVEYLCGDPVPVGGDLMAGILAKELVAACDGSPCRLPKTVVSTTRQGVTHQFDPTKILAAGYTGIPEIDQWVAASNPNRIMQAPVVL